MIFVTVGSEKFPFDRLLHLIDENIRGGVINEEVIGQTGYSSYVPALYNHFKFLPFQEFLNYIQKADIIVSHAGVGSVLSCLNFGKIPIVFPRSKDHGEHLDDHQVEFAEEMDRQHKVITAHNEQELIDKIKYYRGFTRKLHNKNISPCENNLVSFLKSVL